MIPSLGWRRLDWRSRTVLSRNQFLIASARNVIVGALCLRVAPPRL